MKSEKANAKLDEDQEWILQVNFFLSNTSESLIQQDQS